eukprot:scaffold3746_cov152-Skeletonema_marinoi.AAC.1
MSPDVNMMQCAKRKGSQADQSVNYSCVHVLHERFVSSSASVLSSISSILSSYVMLRVHCSSARVCMQASNAYVTFISILSCGITILSMTFILSTVDLFLPFPFFLEVVRLV